MAARRGKTQARRNQGNNGLPGWAWMVLGIVLTIAVVMGMPKLLKSDGDGFFRPRPNPDATPAPVAGGEEDLGVPRADQPRQPAPVEDEEPQYDFYTLLPGKEVRMSDEELAATQRAEAERMAERETAAGSRNEDAADLALPAPVVTEPAPRPANAPATPAPQPDGNRATAAGVGDGSRYLLQAGAFQASGQAEELKARIALLGLGARVESAQIDGKTIYRVRMGPYGTASDLAEAKRKLDAGGLPAMAIKVQ